APVAAQAAPAISLEDELETLLAGSARPVVQRSANASWGYGSRSNVVGRTEPAPVISRATAYQHPVAEPEPAPVAYEAPATVAYQQPVAQEPAPVAYAVPEVSYEPQTSYVEEQELDIEIEDAFDDEELMAALDDFEVPMDVEEQSAPVREQIAVPVAASIAGAPKLPEVHALSDYADELDRAAKSVQAPDVDTIAVTENRVDYTESLDLPAVNYEDDAPQHNGLSELESEFAEVFGSIESDTQHNDFAATEEPVKTEAAKDEYADIFADVFGNEAEQGRYNQAGYATAGVAAAGVAGIASQAPAAAAPRYQHGPEDDNTDFGYDPRRDDVDMAAGVYAQNENKPRRNALFVPGIAAAVVLVAVAGAVAYKWTGSTGGEPVVIMADKTPIKVQPEKTANAVVPNQDKAVFDKGATTAPVTPKQEQLVTTREDPVDLAADEDDEVPIADKVDARVEPADQDLAANEPAPERNGALAPRKVQTMVVKPDGTMVASITPDTPPAGTGAAAAPVERPGGTATGPASSDDPVGALAGAEPVEAEPALAPVKPAAVAPVAPKAPVAAKPVETKKITQETVASAPRNVPVVESRPAEQPLEIVDRVPPKTAAPQQVASAAPAAGSYFIQVASQPSVEGAQKTYASLSQKHAGVIGGRGVDIKQAEIAGKGTFYRVRIPAGSKADAANLCSKYKSAGGSCFVTQ
ncbi:SPOR domain-containing protein, partial [Phyllobacterium sp. YR531]|uniref:SPOR domain-containing protein n=1 Tax=Phyllobacterium sp. YR531 TaxID=1144343 RepID=UPI00026FB1E9